MKKIILLFCIVALLIFLAACTPPPDTSSNLEQQELLNQEQIKEIDKIKEESAAPPKPVEKPKPTGGEIKVSAHTKTQLPLLDEFLDVEMSANGKFSYEIAEDGVVSGKGGAVVIIDITAPFSDSSTCQAHEEVPVDFSVSGAYQFATDTLLYFSHDPKPESISVTLTCPYAGADLTYELPVPLYFFAGDNEKPELVFTSSPKITKKIFHPVPAWETEVEAEWTFETLTLLEDFDFDVDVDPPIVSVEQGQVAKAQVVVKKVRGDGQVTLTHTDWSGIQATLSNDVLTPTSTTEFIVETDCNTAVDTYLYTIQGDAGVIKQSVDTVSIVVEKSAGCP